MKNLLKIINLVRKNEHVYFLIRAFTDNIKYKINYQLFFKM